MEKVSSVVISNGSAFWRGVLKGGTNFRSGIVNKELAGEKEVVLGGAGRVAGMVGGGHLDLVETVFHTLGGEGVDGVGEFIAKSNPVIHGELADLHLEMKGVTVGIISVPSGRKEAVLGIK